VYSVNDIPLDNKPMGWEFQSTSRPIARLTFERPSISTAGMDGVPALLPARVPPPVVMYVVKTRRATLETLIDLFASGHYITRSDMPTRQVDFELMDVVTDDPGFIGADVKVTFTVRYPGVYWMDKATTTTTAANLSSASTVVGGLFSGTSAPIQEPMVRLRGAFTGLQVVDGGGSWFAYDGSVPSGSYLRVSVGSMRGWVTTSDVWTGGTEVSGNLDFGGPRSVFELQPVSSAPGSRAVSVTVSTATRSSAQFQVRARGAYLV